MTLAIVTNLIDTEFTLAHLLDVFVRYNSAAPVVLTVPELTIRHSEFVSIVGASGSGKSTLLRLIAGLIPPTSGTIRTQQADNQTQTTIGMVFQSANLIPWRTGEGNVRLPGELGKHTKTVSSSRIDELFHLVGLTSADRDKRVSELSGGMQMRVSLARSLVQNPDLLLMDEPFSALDDLLRMQLEEDVRRIHDQQSLTTVLVTHNITEAVFMSDRVIVLGNRPSTIHKDIEIKFPQARTKAIRIMPEFHSAVTKVTEALRTAAVTTPAG